jgi:hypothetical protein
MISLDGTITAVQGMSMVVTVVVTNHSPWPMTFQDLQWWISTGGWNLWDVAKAHQPTAEFTLAPFGTCELSFMIEFSEVSAYKPLPSMVAGRASVRMDAYLTILYLTKTFVFIETPY